MCVRGTSHHRLGHADRFIAKLNQPSMVQIMTKVPEVQSKGKEIKGGQEGVWRLKANRGRKVRRCDETAMKGDLNIVEASRSFSSCTRFLSLSLSRLFLRGGGPLVIICSCQT